MLPRELSKQVPKSHLMSEEEWRRLGVQQSLGWVHYMIHEPGKHIWTELDEQKSLKYQLPGAQLKCGVHNCSCHGTQLEFTTECWVLLISLLFQPIGNKGNVTAFILNLHILLPELQNASLVLGMCGLSVDKTCQAGNCSYLCL